MRTRSNWNSHPLLVGRQNGAATLENTSVVSCNFIFIYLFIYFWLRWVFVAVRGLSLVAASGVYSSLQCAGFSLRWLLLLRSTGSRCVGFSSCGSRALERRLSSCGARAQLLPSMWDLPGPGLEPMSPAPAGGFLTTVPPGKSVSCNFNHYLTVPHSVTPLPDCTDPREMKTFTHTKAYMQMSTAALFTTAPKGK